MMSNENQEKNGGSCSHGYDKKKYSTKIKQLKIKAKKKGLKKKQANRLCYEQFLQIC